MQLTSTITVVAVMSLALTATGASRALPARARTASYSVRDSTRATDPLTGLPLDPETACRTPVCIQYHTPNDPVKMPDAIWCKSKMQGDFYSITGSTKVSSVVAWYGSHLPGFKMTHAYASGRSDDTFYNSAGTLFVLVMGNPAQDGVDLGTYSVTYYRVQPGLSEKSIIGLNRQQRVCP